MESIHCYSFFSQFDMDFHKHEGLEINLAIGKDVIYYVGKDTVHLKEGECIIIDPDYSHKLCISGNYSGVYGIVMDKKLFLNPIINSNDSYYVINTSKLVRSVIIDLVNRFYADKNDKSLSLCLSYLLDHLDIEKNSLLVFMVKKYINEHYSEGLSIQKIADYFHISKVHLQRIYKEKTGSCIWEHVNKKRAMTAAYLLETTTLSVEEIASAVGANSRQALYSIFKQQFNMSLQKYRKLMKDNVG